MTGPTAVAYKVQPDDTDTGCQHGECLECPLPACKYEQQEQLRGHGKPRRSCDSVLERREEACQLRRMGWSTHAIASRLGLTIWSVYQDISRARASKGLRKGRQVASQRRSEVLRLMELGWSYLAIAAFLGVSLRRVYQIAPARRSKTVM